MMEETDLREFTLTHRKQDEDEHCCFHYACYALTQDQYFLREEVKQDVSSIRSFIRLHHRGWVSFPIYDHVQEPMGEAEWDWLLNHLLPDEYGATRMLITYPWSHEVQGSGKHTVAGLLFHSEELGARMMAICDSCRDGIRKFLIPDFLETRYAEAVQIVSLHEPNLESFPAHPADESYEQALERTYGK